MHSLIALLLAERTGGPLNLPLSLYATFTVLILAAAVWLLGRARLRSAAGWLALALAGQACALQLVWAGPGIRLQMFQGWGDLLRGYRAAFFLAVGLQLMVAMVGAWRVWPQCREKITGVLTWPRVFMLLALYAYSCTTIAPEFAQTLVAGSSFPAKLAVQVTKVALGLLIFATGGLTLALAVTHLPEDVWAEMQRRWNALAQRRVEYGAALWVVLVSSLLAWTVLDRMPHLADEVCYLFQAKYFSTGQLWLPPPADADALFAPFSGVDDGKWYAATVQGWPAVLALGVWIGMPWIVNPLLGGAAILLTHAVLRRLYGQAIARGAVLLMALSPWLLFISASLMPHAVTLVFALLAVWGVVRARHDGSIVGGALAGLGCGALFHVRPLDGILVAAALGLWWLAARQLRFAPLLAAGVSGVAMLALFLGYNHALTGDALSTPMNRYADRVYYPGINRLGFGADVGNVGWTGLDALPGHGPVDVFMNTNQNLYLLNFEMFGWTFGSLLLIYLLALRRGAGQAEHKSADRLMWMLLLILIVGLNLYWFGGGPDFGARYWYATLLPLVALTVRAVQVFSPRVERVGALVALASILGAVTVLPWRSLDKYHGYRGTSSSIRDLASQHDWRRGLVLVRGKGWWPDYASASSLNPRTLDAKEDGPIFARDLGEESRARLRKAYPDRTIWVIAGPAESGQPFHVVEGPLPPEK